MLNEVKISVYEPLYTLTEEEKILNLRRAKGNRAKLRRRKYFVKQRLVGTFLILLSIIIRCTVPFPDVAEGFFYLYFILGTVITLSKSQIFTFKEWEGWR